MGSISSRAFTFFSSSTARRLVLLRVQRDLLLHDAFHVSTELLKANFAIVVHVDRLKHALPELTRVLHNVVGIAVTQDALNVILLKVT